MNGDLEHKNKNEFDGLYNIIYTNLIGYNAILEIIARGEAEGKLF